jgi:hypothetical protein
LDQSMGWPSWLRGTVGGWGLRNNLKAIHGLPFPEFRESRAYKQGPKITIWKTMTGETHLQWNQLLPVTLFRIRYSHTKQIGLSPFEILFWHPPP